MGYNYGLAAKSQIKFQLIMHHGSAMLNEDHGGWLPV